MPIAPQRRNREHQEMMRRRRDKSRGYSTGPSPKEDVPYILRCLSCDHTEDSPGVPPGSIEAHERMKAHVLTHRTEGE